jgi:hypothetical protein
MRHPILVMSSVSTNVSSSCPNTRAAAMGALDVLRKWLGNGKPTLAQQYRRWHVVDASGFSGAKTTGIIPSVCLSETSHVEWEPKRSSQALSQVGRRSPFFPLRI